MSVPRLSLVVLVGLVLGTAPASGQLSGRCFDATLGPWSPIEGTHTLDGPPVPPPDQSSFLGYEFPPRVLLTALPLRRGSEEWRRVDVPEGALPVARPFRNWRATEDSLWISLSDRFTSTLSVLVRAPDRWAGILRNSSDNVGTQLYSRPIELQEADCQSPPPVPASGDTPAPRVVPSSSGPPIALAELLPDVYEVRLSQSRFSSAEWVVDPAPSGYWVGTDSVRVGRNRDGLVSEIDVRYPEGFDPTALRSGLLAEFGSGRAVTIGGSSVDRLSWQNGSTRASLLIGGGLVRVLLIDPRMQY